MTRDPNTVQPPPSPPVATEPPEEGFLKASETPATLVAAALPEEVDGLITDLRKAAWDDGADAADAFACSPDEAETRLRAAISSALGAARRPAVVLPTEGNRYWRELAHNAAVRARAAESRASAAAALLREVLAGTVTDFARDFTIKASPETYARARAFLDGVTD